MKNNFTQRVLKVVRNIKKGSALSYKQVARMAGSTGAFRAVGTIMSKNYDKSVPCHRVICSDGTLGGYNRGGITKKEKLLQKEEFSIKK